MIGQLLSESDAQLQAGKSNIVSAVGQYAQVIIEVIPELVRIIGEQPPAPELSGTAAQNRFNLLFQKFTQVFMQAEHPLVMFLDDLEQYDRAIALAKENQFLNEEALADELAAKFYLDWGKEKIAQVYMTEAYYCYARWGAKAKVVDLETRYPQLLFTILQKVLFTSSRHQVKEQNLSSLYLSTGV